MKRLILVDGNNWGFAGMANPRLSAGGRDTQAIYSVLKRTRELVEAHPDALIMFLWDGRSWRKDFDSTYKANRESNPAQVAIKDDYLLQKKEIMEGLRLLGLTQATSGNMEADDLAYILTTNALKKGMPVTLLTADHDWMQLVQRGVVWINVIHNQRCRFPTFKEDTGYDNAAQFVEAKCVLGDAGDNVKGVIGVGPKALEGVYGLYKSFDAFLTGMEFYSAKQIDKWKSHYSKMMPKALREIDVAATRATIAKNLTLMDLATLNRPQAAPIQKIKQPLDRRGFETFCNRNGFRSFTRLFDEFMEPFERSVQIAKPERAG